MKTEVRKMQEALEEIRLAVLSMAKVLARMDGYRDEIPELTELPALRMCPTHYEEEK